MFKIFKLGGNQLGFAEEIRYIKRNKNNSCFIGATKEDAIGIVFKSKQYNLIGCNSIEDAETVYIKEFDGGALVEKLQDENAQLKQQLEDADEALIELYERLGEK